MKNKNKVSKKQYRFTWSQKLLLSSVLAGWLFLREQCHRQHRVDLRHRTVVITGGSRGLGFALAKACAQQGAQVAICGRDQQTLDNAQRDLEAFEAKVLALRCDVSVQQQAEQMIQQVIDTFGGIDILINNAGIITVGAEKNQSIEDYRQSFEVIFWGMAYTTFAALPHFKAQKHGHIVNITSLGGRVSMPHLIPYNAAKFAAYGFSQGMHAELADDAIHVLTVVPGLMRTGSHMHIQTKGQHTQEYGWFSFLSLFPLASTSAEQAAAIILRALKKRKTEVIITVQAQVIVRLASLFPGLTTKILSLINRLLPKAGEGMERQEGHEAVRGWTKLPTFLGRFIARNYNQLSMIDLQMERE